MTALEAEVSSLLSSGQRQDKSVFASFRLVFICLLQLLLVFQSTKACSQDFSGQFKNKIKSGRPLLYFT